MNTLWLAAAATAVLAAAATPVLAADAAPDLTKSPRMGSWGFDLSGRDPKVSPGQDFYDYANGTYVEKLAIPADRSRYGAFDALAELSMDRMRAVLEKAAADSKAVGPEAEIGTLYRSFMDEAGIEALGGRSGGDQGRQVQGGCGRPDGRVPVRVRRLHLRRLCER
jgi:putative endopeptidase